MTTEKTNAREARQPVFRTDGFHHVALRVTDLVRSRAFYTTVLGFPVVLEAEGLILVSVEGTLLGLQGGAPETETSDRFSPFRVGLDHVALGVTNTGVLRDLQRHLDVAGVPNDGIEEDTSSGKVRVRFYDPDGIAWELFASCERTSAQAELPPAAM